MEVQLSLDGGVATIHGLHPGEPIFVLRGQDALALPSLINYHRSAQFVMPNNKAEELHDLISQFVEYQRIVRIKLPD